MTNEVKNRLWEKVFIRMNLLSFVGRHSISESMNVVAIKYILKGIRDAQA